MKVNLLNLNGDIEIKKIHVDYWKLAHKHKIKHFYSKELDLFLKKYNLNPTYFNLNCLYLFKGVILTDKQVLVKMKGGLKE